MSRTPLLLIIAAFFVLGGAIILAQNHRLGPSTVSNERGVQVDAPGTRVESDNDSTRIQAPGVDITVPKNKDEN